MIRFATGLGCCLLLLACDSKHGPSRPPGLVDSEGKQVQQAPLVAPPDGKATAPGRAASFPSLDGLGSSDGLGRSTGPTSATAQVPVGAPGQSTQPTAPGAGKTDQVSSPEAELEAKLQGCTSCLDLEKAAQTGTVTITATAQVVPSGRITRVTASATQQPASAVSCIERTLAEASLSGPILDAPRSVSASFATEVRQAKPTAAPVAKPATDAGDDLAGPP